MKAIIIIIILFTLQSCHDQNKKQNTNKEFKSDTIFVKELSDKLHKFKLIYIKKKNYPNTINLKKLEIYIKNRNYKIQEIKIDTIELYENDLYFTIDEDVNFDGYNDICLLNFEGAYTATFSFWLYDKKINKFKHYKGLDEIQNPSILKNKKEICSFWHSGVSTFNLERYFWKNDSLILKEKYEEYETDAKRITITKLKNNKYIVTDSIIKDNVVMFMKCD